MYYASGDAVVESSLCVIGSTAIQIAVDTADDDFCLLLRKGQTGNVLRVHYRRIASLDVSYHVFSVWVVCCGCERRFVQFSFYAKNDSCIKVTVQLSKEEGTPITDSMYRFFSDSSLCTSSSIMNP